MKREAEEKNSSNNNNQIAIILSVLKTVTGDLIMSIVAILYLSRFILSVSR